jgi:hypothetical protein
MISSIPHLRATAALALALGTAAFAAAQVTYTAPYYFSTFTGISAYGHSDGSGSAARFFHPAGIALDSAGNAYITDAGNNTIRKITPAGVVTTLAGSPGLKGDADGIGSAARFDIPWGIVSDVAGNLYVENAGNRTIRKITPQGEVTTLPGQAITSLAPYVAAGRATAIPDNVSFPTLNGWEYIISLGEYYPNGLDQRFAMLAPPEITADSAGNLYGAYDGSINKLPPGGTSTLLAGTPHRYGTADGGGADARFSYTLGLTTDGVGNVFVADRESGTLRKITPAGIVTTIAGAVFASPETLAADPAGNLTVIDSTAVRKVTTTGAVTTLAGVSVDEADRLADGNGSAARLGETSNIALAPNGDLYACDSKHFVIRRITSGGTATVFAGKPGIFGSIDGNATDATFNTPAAIAIDSASNLYVSDRNNHTIRKITPAGIVTTLAGKTGTPGNTDGIGTEATFIYPEHLAVDPSGNVFVVSRLDRDLPGNLLRKIAPNGVVTTIGEVEAGTSFATDRQGAVYVETYGPKISRLASDGTTTLVVDATAGWEHAEDPAEWYGPGFLLSFDIDAAGNVYAASAVGTVRKITPAGRVTTLAGRAFNTASTSGYSGSVDGIGPGARFNNLGSLVIDDATGSLYVADGTTLRKGQLAGPVAITTQPQSQSVTAGKNVQFSVAATGIPAPTYQWRFKGNPISGATAATLSLTSVTSADAGDYTVVATNDLGSATSSAATLAVTSAPVTPSPSSGGGGALGGWFAVLVLVVAGCRLRRDRTAR